MFQTAVELMTFGVSDVPRERSMRVGRYPLRNVPLSSISAPLVQLNMNWRLRDIRCFTTTGVVDAVIVVAHAGVLRERLQHLR